MCSTPKMQMPAPVVAPPDSQAEKPADINAVRRKSKTAATAGGTLLTGPTGIENNSLATGGGSLLGG